MKRARTDADVEAGDRRALEAWWDSARKLGKNAYEAGKVLDLAAIEADEGMKRLFVRKDFDALYRSILTGKVGRWLVHLNGNSGTGKSAFLWYFIIRFAIDMGKRPFVLVYQSGGFIWTFDSNGKVEVIRKSEFQRTSIRNANWHLVNQKVESSDILGRKVLVAASPNPENLKNTIPDRQRSTVYMHPWDRDEFDALTRLWEEEASQLEKEASQLEKKEEKASQFETSDLEKQVQGCSVQDDKIELDSIYDYEVPDEEHEDELPGTGIHQIKLTARKLRHAAGLIRTRVWAAGTYYSWFGGVPRRLWQLDPRHLTNIEMERLVDSSLLKTDLGKVYRVICGAQPADDISCMLLHLKKPQTLDSNYLIDFASTKIKYKFTSSLAVSKREDLRVLLESTDPQLGALRGFIFEQKVVSKVFHSAIRAVLMVDDKHCSECNSRMEGGLGPVNWISCDVCKKWYHYLCVLQAAPVPQRWRCKPCEGKAGDEVVTRRMLRLRYYKGDLKEALLRAGSDAINYTWRPLKKNNTGFDFVILPATLGQATTAQYHQVLFEAIKDGLAALEAWNNDYNKEACPKKFYLSFFLSQDNYRGFGYQSYRNKQGRVSNNGVRGIMQAKVLVQTSDDDDQPQLEQCADIPEPANTVEKLDELAFQPIDFEAMTVEQLKVKACQLGLTGYSSLPKADLIQKLLDSEVFDEVVELDFEKNYYSRHGAVVDE